MHINRRIFMSGALLAASSPAWARVAATDKPTPDQTYSNAIVLDTLTPCDPGFDVQVALSAGLTGGVVDLMKFPRDTDNAFAALAQWNAALADPRGYFHCVRQADDFAQAKANGKFAVVLASQDASILGPPMIANTDDNLVTLRALHKAGLRVLQLTYTTNNGLGGGYSERVDSGLFRLGERVIGEMNALGMLVDTSHCSENTTLQAIALSTRPIAVTHAGCYALFPNKRNKSDPVIRALAEKGGYMGIYNMTLWMTPHDTASVEDIVDHIDHAVKIGGIDLVGFGSDHPPLGDQRTQAVKVEEMQGFAARNPGFPGGESVHGQVTAGDMDGPDRLRVLARALSRRGYPASQVEKILGGNFVRTFRAACG
jgi:membrane dipeptidase